MGKSHAPEDQAFVEVCARWGPPEVVRSDNRTEFVNANVDSMFDVFGITVKHGAVRHPQSQGVVECFHRSLLKGNSHQKISVANMIELLLKSFLVYHTPMFEA